MMDIIRLMHNLRDLFAGKMDVFLYERVIEVINEHPSLMSVHTSRLPMIHRSGDSVVNSSFLVKIVVEREGIHVCKRLTP